MRYKRGFGYGCYVSKLIGDTTSNAQRYQSFGFVNGAKLNYRLRSRNYGEIAPRSANLFRPSRRRLAADVPASGHPQYMEPG